MKTLKDVLPPEFMGGSYDAAPAFKLANVRVAREHEFSWPGRHKHVCYWCELENGKAVGWNENPSHGWSFPVIKFEK